MSELNKTQKEKIYYLYFVENKKIEEIASIFNVTPRRIYQILKKEFPNEYKSKKEKESLKRNIARRIKESERVKKWQARQKQNEEGNKIQTEESDIVQRKVKAVQEYIELYHNRLNYFQILDKDFEFQLSKKHNLEVEEIEKLLTTYFKSYKYILQQRSEAEEYSLIRNHIIDTKLMSKSGVPSISTIFDLLQSSYSQDKDMKYYYYTEKYGAKPNDIPSKIKIKKNELPLTTRLKQKMEEEKTSSAVEREILRLEEKLSFPLLKKAAMTLEEHDNKSTG